MAGIRYLSQVARQTGRPMVLYITMGTNGEIWGSLLNRYLEAFGNEKGRCVVVGGGNEGNQGHHFAESCAWRKGRRSSMSTRM